MDQFEDDYQDEDAVLPLRERMPDYAAVFGVGLAGSVVVGFIFFLIADIGFASAIGYTIILYGVVLLLAGGATGGGYTNLGIGAVGALFGTRRADEPQSEVEETWGTKPKADPHDRLAKGLRPEANPRAFWQVMGGVLYVGIGLLIVIAGS
ncbi:MAG: hypothetical protein ACR2N2_12830 [Acidimicrobiia bacterium]